LAYEAYAAAGGTLKGSNSTSFGFFGNSQTQQLNLTLEVQQPFLATNTYVSSFFTDPSITGINSGLLNNTTSYTAFTVNAEAGSTFTGGTIYVYGYKK
jgi:hypothetical protein